MTLRRYNRRLRRTAISTPTRRSIPRQYLVEACKRKQQTICPFPIVAPDHGVAFPRVVPPSPKSLDSACVDLVGGGTRGEEKSLCVWTGRRRKSANVVMCVHGCLGKNASVHAAVAVGVGYAEQYSVWWICCPALTGTQMSPLQRVSIAAPAHTSHGLSQPVIARAQPRVAQAIAAHCGGLCAVKLSLKFNS